MSEHDMNHMNYIDAVRTADVATLREKEKTYRGSWKKGGGRSAWFMARRNMDRLLTMMERPKPQGSFNLTNVNDTISALETDKRLPGNSQATADMVRHLRDAYISDDIFAMIAADPSGADGTVLAVIRDMRCYFTLVEAEMRAQGVVSTPVTTGVDIETIDDWADRLNTERMVPRMPRTDSNKHATASLFPWEINNGQKSMIDSRSMTAARLVDLFYKRVSPHALRLEPIVYAGSGLLQELSTCYDCSIGVSKYVLRINKLPAELRDNYPYLQREMNNHEYENSNEDFRFMYTLLGEKWTLDAHLSEWAAN